MTYFHLGADADAAPSIENPRRWYYAFSEDAEWWGCAGAAREEAIARASEAGEPAFICEARRMVPNFKGFFDGAEIAERINEDECWGEDGWEGDPGEYAELETALDAVLASWFASLKHPLYGAQLDMTHGPERVG